MPQKLVEIHDNAEIVLAGEFVLLKCVVYRTIRDSLLHTVRNPVLGMGKPKRADIGRHVVEFVRNLVRFNFSMGRLGIYKIQEIVFYK